MTVSRNRAMLCVVLVGALAGLTTGASPPAWAAGSDGILVQRNDQAGTATVVIPSHDGAVRWNDVLHGLVRAGGLDDAALSPKSGGKHLDLTRRGSRLGVLALSAVIPDVSVRVISNPNTSEPALRIRLDRDDARAKTLRVKAWVRHRLGRDAGSYGLRLDDAGDRQPGQRPLVVLIHGYGAGPEALDALHEELVKRGWPCAMFAYPNDGPLAESAQLLANELRDFQERHADRSVVIVAHSMGGLVARAVIEDPTLDPGNVERLLMVCTPNHGTQWAELPGGLDCLEHLRSQPDQTLIERFRASIADGLNEARADLKPGSPFLRTLNDRRRNPHVRYSLILGTGAPLTASQVAHLREYVAQSFAGGRTGRLILPRVNHFFDGLDEVECGKGDGVVSVERGGLDGVEDTLLLPVAHWTLSAGPGQPGYRLLRDAILERLAQ